MTRYPLITSTEIGLLLQVGARTVREWAHRDDFPQPAGKTGRANLYPSADVVFWYLNHEIAKRIAPADGEPAVLDLATERARLARAQAEEKEMAVAQRRGELVPAGLATQALAGAVTAAKTTFLSVAGKCADIRPDAPPELLEEIRRLHHEALTELADAPIPGAGNGAKSRAI